MEFNTEFKCNILDVYGAAGKTWLDDLPVILKDLSLAWNFRFLESIPNMSWNFIGLVEMNSSAGKAVVKVAPVSTSLTCENRWLNCIGGGVPQVYHYDEKNNALLLEYLEPGDTLKSMVDAGNDDQATKILCQTIRELQSNQNVVFGFRHLSDMADSFHVLKGMFDDDLLSRAQSLYQDLTEDTSKDVLLHGDLHHDNVLASGKAWKAIDPHGYMGDPAAEVGALIRNPFNSFPKKQSLKKTIQRRLDILSDELPFDPGRIKAWAFCMTVLSIAWAVDDHGKMPQHTCEIAELLTN